MRTEMLLVRSVIFVFCFFVDRSEDKWFCHDFPERQHCQSAGALHGELWSMVDLRHFFSVRCPWRGGLKSLADLGQTDSPLPLAKVFVTWTGRTYGLSLVEHLDKRTVPCPSRRSLSLWTGQAYGWSLVKHLDERTVPCPLRRSLSLWTGQTYGRSLVEHLDKRTVPCPLRRSSSL